jgi:ribosomal protein S27E
MSHYIIAGGAFERAFDAMPEECRLPWTCGIDDEARGGKKTQKGQEAARKVKVKYSCPGCALNVWGRAGLRLCCEDCDQELVAADGGAVDECADAPVRKAA